MATIGRGVSMGAGGPVTAQCALVRCAGARGIIQAHWIKLLSSFQSLKSKRNLLAASTLRLKIAAY